MRRGAARGACWAGPLPSMLLNDSIRRPGPCAPLPSYPRRRRPRGRPARLRRFHRSRRRSAARQRRHRRRAHRPRQRRGLARRLLPGPAAPALQHRRRRTIPASRPSSTTETDGDGVPDDATYTFTAPPCRYTGVRGFTLDVVGQLRIVDPAPDTPGFGADITLTALRFSLSADDSDKNYSVTRNGTITLTGSPGRSRADHGPPGAPHLHRPLRRVGGAPVDRGIRSRRTPSRSISRCPAAR